MKRLLILLLISSLSSQAQDTIFRQRGNDLYITTRRGTALVQNQNIYERHFNYNLQSEKRERNTILIVDAILLAAFFTARALINKN